MLLFTVVGLLLFRFFFVDFSLLWLRLFGDVGCGSRSSFCGAAVRRVATVPSLSLDGFFRADVRV